MRLTWYGHAAFLIETEQGTRLVIDPYLSGSYNGQMAHAPIDDTADAVLVTHSHPDHSAADTIGGQPEVFFRPTRATVGDAEVTGVAVFHDEAGGSQRGENTIILVEADGVRLAHLGDLGHDLDDETQEALGKVDVLLVPVGGFFTIDAEAATRVAQKLSPRVIVPMHYRTEGCRFDIAGVDDFLRGRDRVERPGTSTIDLTAATLPEQPTVVVLEHAR
jgi:L-ascorbate metabolism protein UlaG (beta-lactamase superfamily)